MVNQNLLCDIVNKMYNSWWFSLWTQMVTFVSKQFTHVLNIIFFSFYLIIFTLFSWTFFSFFCQTALFSSSSSFSSFSLPCTSLVVSLPYFWSHGSMLKELIYKSSSKLHENALFLPALLPLALIKVGQI